MTDEHGTFSSNENDYLELLKKVNEDNKMLKSELEEQKRILNSQNEILNIIMSNKFIKANGLLRKLQLHTLELVKFIDNVCSKYDLKFWLEFGTLLGAVRHEGFIPWDDEVDLAMLRSDYEKFMEVLPIEIERFEGLKKQLNVRKGSYVFKNAEYTEKSKTPVLQFIHKKPHAGVEVYPLDYLDIPENDTDRLNQIATELVNERNKFRHEYKNGICSFEDGIVNGNAKVGIVYTETDILVNSLDGANRKPIPISDVFPLKKCRFEGCEFNMPRNPLEYLSTYYSGNVMKIPKEIRHHHFTDQIQKIGSNEELDKLYDETIQFWRNINNNF